MVEAQEGRQLEKGGDVCRGADPRVGEQLAEVLVELRAAPLGEGLGQGAIQLIVMNASVMVWVGEVTCSPPRMGPLVFAISTRFEKMPLASALIEFGDSFGSGVAQRLAKVWVPMCPLR